MPSNISYDLVSPTFYDHKIYVLHQNVSSPLPTLVPSPVRQTSLTYNALVNYAEILRLPLVAIFILSIPFIFNFVATWLFFQVRHWSKEAAKKPPTIPHLLPWIGNVYSLTFDTLNFVKWCTYVDSLVAFRLTWVCLLANIFPGNVTTNRLRSA